MQFFQGTGGEMETGKIIILPAPNCRRSKRILEYLKSHDIPYERLDLDSSEGQALAASYEMRASPGILVDGVSINPFDLLVQPGCRVNGEKAQNVFNVQAEEKISDKKGK
jgi:glutaredoxin